MERSQMFYADNNVYFTGIINGSYIFGSEISSGLQNGIFFGSFDLDDNIKFVNFIDANISLSSSFSPNVAFNNGNLYVSFYATGDIYVNNTLLHNVQTGISLIVIVTDPDGLFLSLYEIPASISSMSININTLDNDVAVLTPYILVSASNANSIVKRLN